MTFDRPPQRPRAPVPSPAARSFARAGLTSVVVMGLNVATGVVVARTLGAENRGYLAIIIFWPQLLAALSRLPLSNVIVVLKGQGHGTGDLAAAALRTAFWSIVIATPVIVGATLLIQRGSSPDMIQMSVIFAVVLVFCSQQTQVFEGLLRATGRYDLMNALRISVPLGYLVFGSFVAFLQWGVAGFVVAHVLAMLLSYGFRILLFRGPAEAPAETVPVPTTPAIVLRSAASFYGVGLSAYLTANIDRFFLMLVAPPQMIGQYFVAMTVAQPVNTIVTTMLQYVGLPELVAMSGARRGQAFGRLVRMTVIVAVLSVLVVVVLAPPLVPLVFSADFAPAGILAAQLSCALMLAPVRQAVSQMLMAVGAARAVSVSNAVFVGVFALSFLALTGWLADPESFAPLVMAFLAGNLGALAVVLIAVRRHDPALVGAATLLPRRSDLAEIGRMVRAVVTRRRAGRPDDHDSGGPDP